MPDHTPPTRGRRGSQVLSTILFIAALGFAAAAVYIWYLDDTSSTEEPPIPTAENGKYQLANVLQALQEGGVDADYGRSPATAKANQLDLPGQNIRVGDTNVFVFLFPGDTSADAVAAREEAFTRIDPATLTLTTPSGSDVSRGEPLTVYQGGNVIAVMVGGDAELQGEVQRVIEGLS